MNINQSIQSAQKTLESSAQKFTPAAMQEAFQPLMGNAKAWGDLLQQQAQASQNAVSETFEAFKNVKEPQAALEAMGTFAQTLMAMASKNMKDTVALSVSQFKSNVTTLEKNLPASDAVTSIANSMKDSASQLESTVESTVNDSAAAAKKARTS